MDGGLTMLGDSAGDSVGMCNVSSFLLICGSDIVGNGASNGAKMCEVRECTAFMGYKIDTTTDSPSNRCALRCTSFP